MEQPRSHLGFSRNTLSLYRDSTTVSQLVPYSGTSIVAWRARYLQPRSLLPWSLQPRSLQLRYLQPRSLQPQSLQPRYLQPRSLQPWSLHLDRYIKISFVAATSIFARLFGPISCNGRTSIVLQKPKIFKHYRIKLLVLTFVKDSVKERQPEEITSLFARKFSGCVLSLWLSDKREAYAPWWLAVVGR